MPVDCLSVLAPRKYGFWGHDGVFCRSAATVKSSRFVPVDLSYPDDSYPGSDISYTLNTYLTLVTDTYC